jgi:hypothetical protein
MKMGKGKSFGEVLEDAERHTPEEQEELQEFESRQTGE